MLRGTFTSAEAAHLGRFKTAMMVDYLCRAGIVVPSSRGRPGRGRPRLFTLGDVVLLRTLNRLLSSGMPVIRLKVAIDRIRRHFRRLSPETPIKRYLITDGREVFLADEPNALMDLNRDGRLTFAFIVDIEHARGDVLRTANASPHRYFTAAKLR